MSKEIEIEFKNLVNHDEFYKLLESFHIDESDFVIQHNDYFDTPSFELKAQGAALRIREKRGNFTLTLKEPCVVGLVETHQSLTKIEAENMLHGEAAPRGEVDAALHRLKVNTERLKHLGRLTTHRAEVSYRDGLLVFDHSFYGEKEDFELEYEVKNAETGKKAFLEILEKYGILQRPTDNKIKRLMTLLS